VHVAGIRDQRVEVSEVAGLDDRVAVVGRGQDDVVVAAEAEDCSGDELVGARGQAGDPVQASVGMGLECISKAAEHELHRRGREVRVARHADPDHAASTSP
jgi:hypothetical protein